MDGLAQIIVAILIGFGLMILAGGISSWLDQSEARTCLEFHPPADCREYAPDD